MRWRFANKALAIPSQASNSPLIFKRRLLDAYVSATSLQRISRFRQAGIEAKMGNSTVVTKMSRYTSLWVMPVTARSVKTAPLCGSVSKPPDERDATR